MTDNLKVGSLEAAPASKVVGAETLELAGHVVETPLFLINGARVGPTLAVTAGIHGSEFASIEAALQFGKSLKPSELKGRVVVVPVANVPAFRARSIYVGPLDGINLNRVFPGKAEGTASEQLAYWLFQNVIGPADYYVDMHGGDMIEALVPFTIFANTGDSVVDQRSLEMARAYGISYVVRSETRGGTYAAAAQAGIPAILTEAGGQGIWLPEHVATHVNGLNRLMRHLGMLEGPEPEPLPIQMLEQFIWLRSDLDGYYYPRITVDEVVREGQDIGAVTDFQGRVLQSITSPTDGRVLFLVSSLAINKGDPLVAIGA